MKNLVCTVLMVLLNVVIGQSNTPIFPKNNPEIAIDCPAPINLTVSNITQNSAQILWNAVAGALKYEVNYHVAGTVNWQTLVVVAPNTTAVLGNLSPSSGYIWRVRSRCDGQIFSDWSVLADFHTLAANICAKPVDLVTTNINQNSAQIAWNPVAGALGYQVDFKIAGTATWASIFVNAPTVTTILASLVANTTYIWHVRAKCDGQIFSDWSDEKTFQTLMEPLFCPKPQGLVTTNITQTSAQLSWNIVAGAIGYEINYALAGTTNWVSVLVFAPLTTLNLSNLAIGTTYIWRIRAKCDNQMFSDWSVLGEFHTLANVNNCTKPVDLTATNITQTSAQLSWNPVVGAVGYEVNYKIAGTANWLSIGVIAPLVTLNLANLTIGTVYIWRVRAKCDNQMVSDWSNEKDFHTLGATINCLAPHEFSVHNLTHHSALLIWNAVSSTLGYEIQLRKVGTTNWVSFFVIGNPPAHQFQAGNLIAEMDYEWRVRSKCDGQIFSDWSPTQLFMTLPEPPPPMDCFPPTILEVSQITHYSAKFSWPPVAGAFSYQLAVREINTTDWKNYNVIGNPVPSMFSVFNLSPNMQYEARVRTKCGQNLISDWSPIVTFSTIIAPPCSIPMGLTSDSITYFSAKLSWSAVSGATQYRVRFRKFGTQVWKNKTIVGMPPPTFTFITGLPATTTIEWQVKTICGTNSESGWSALATFLTVAPPPCDAPTQVSVTNLTAFSAKFSWNPTNGALIYKVRYRKINTNGQPSLWKIKIISGNPPATMTTVDGLMPESKYELQIQANCGPGSISVWSATAIFQTPPQFQSPNDPTRFLNQKNNWKDVKISPNPTADLTTIRFESLDESIVNLQLFDLYGKLILTTQLAVNQGFNEFEINFQEQSSGLYCLKIQDQSQLLMERIQVIH
jgi:Secretion system C-terminal sorting domain/Fibronectin type III domain